MMLQRSAVAARPLTAARATAASPLQTAVRARSSVAVRFQGRRPPEMEQLPRRPTDTKLNQQQLEEIYNKEPGNISPRTAELRADLGSAVTDLSQVQSFDGPIPETVNGRLAALGFVMAIVEEWTTGRGLLQQVVDHPLRILFIGLLFGFASYAPVVRGYTRKEPFANYFLGLPWLPKIENWNGRVAMLGFVAMVLTEAVTGVNTLQAWGFQPVAQAVSSLAGSSGGGVL